MTASLSDDHNNCHHFSSSLSTRIPRRRPMMIETETFCHCSLDDNNGAQSCTHPMINDWCETAKKIGFVKWMEWKRHTHILVLNTILLAHRIELKCNLYQFTVHTHRRRLSPAKWDFRHFYRQNRDCLVSGMHSFLRSKCSFVHFARCSRDTMYYKMLFSVMALVCKQPMAVSAYEPNHNILWSANEFHVEQVPNWKLENDSDSFWNNRTRWKSDRHRCCTRNNFVFTAEAAAASRSFLPKWNIRMIHACSQ